MSDPTRNVIAEKIYRKKPYPDETDSAFGDQPLTVNETLPFGIYSQQKSRIMDVFKDEIRRRDTNENKRQKLYDDNQRAKEAAFRIRKKEPVSISAKPTNKAHPGMNMKLADRKIDKPLLDAKDYQKQELVNANTNTQPKRVQRNVSMGNMKDFVNMEANQNFYNANVNSGKRGNIKNSFQEAF